MDVNSAFKGFFSKGLTVGPRMAGMVLVIFFVSSSFTTRSGHDILATQVNLIIRQIGHRLLLQAGDSTSRVMPVRETKDGTFVLEFENKFVFSHDSLLTLSQGLLPKTQFPSGYTVTVLDCTTASIVYGFQLNNNSPDLLACRGRRQPSGCYKIEFAFRDFPENIEPTKAGIDEPAKTYKLFKVEPQLVDPKRKEFKAAAFDHDIERATEEPKSFNLSPQEADPKLEGFKTTTPEFPLTNPLYVGMMVVLLGVSFLIGRFGKVRVQHQTGTIVTGSAPELTSLGKFLFDEKAQRLLLGSEVISLTDKECRILELLNINFGELIPRETLMQKVWFDEGVITGRSLDMFVSKLRKKLSGDPEVRITNVHGKGYKLEIAEVI